MTGLPPSTARPWGRYTVLDAGAAHQVKQIVVHPGMRPSYQRHRYRAEHWVVVAGAGRVTVDGTTTAVTPGDAVDVALGAAHRIENTGREDLVFIEVQLGSYLGEDDILRLEDDFGRTGEDHAT